MVRQRENEWRLKSKTLTVNKASIVLRMAILSL